MLYVPGSNNETNRSGCPLRRMSRRPASISVLCDFIFIDMAHSCSKCVRRIRREKSVEVNPLYVAYDNPCDAKLWPQRHVQLGASDCCCALRAGVPDLVLAVDATDSFNQVINSAAFAGESASTTSRKTGSVPENRNKSQLSFSR